ncbi:ExeM/NucH family extracellular endonuclease [Aeromonas finlandensis]|uniref:ExeM/NucH family extracellular endonuclease n=1 Tax=Aeromonas finlandensis TaxID=1543375 RepID=UPI00051B3BC3|nr:ExeM/NucH family extracellular endonuclease [Aeromonas finlandensis]
MNATRNLLSLAIGLALASPSVFAYDCPTDQVTPISQLRADYQNGNIAKTETANPTGSGFTSTETRVVKGQVTAIGKGLTKGIYLTDTQAGNAQESAGIFVFLPDAEKKLPGLKPGSEVCLETQVQDFFGGIQLRMVGNNIQINDGSAAPTPVMLKVREGESLAETLKRHEGMLVALDSASDLRITRTYAFDYGPKRSNMVLSHKAPLLKPTQLYEANSPEAIALHQANQNNQLVVETDSKAKDGKIAWFPDLDADTGYLRVGDQIPKLQGVVAFEHGKWRLILSPDALLKAGDIQDRQAPRQHAPARTDGTLLRLGSFNVLNYFTSGVGGDINPTCGDAFTPKCNRGAPTAEEFQLQRVKIVHAILDMDADLLGLMEIENNGYKDGAAVKNLVDELNKGLPADKQYTYVIPDSKLLYKGKFFGSDAIGQAIIYRPALLTPQGAADIIRMPVQKEAGVRKASQRDSLVQTFNVKGESEPLTLVVNHLKSKREGCLEKDDGKSDPTALQGFCNQFRVSAAKALGDAVSKLPGQVLLVGDFNSYAKEDPIRVLTDYVPNPSHPITTGLQTYLGLHYTDTEQTELGDAPYTDGQQFSQPGYGLIDLNVKFNGKEAISYSFDGEQGTLDYALANKAMAKRVLKVSDWHINSYEMALFEYGKKNSGGFVKSENMYRSSDHDPVIIDLKAERSATNGSSTTDQENTTTTATTSGGGALGFGLLALLPLAWRRRR